MRYGLSRGIRLDDWRELSYREKQSIIIACEKMDVEEQRIRLALAGVKEKSLPRWTPPRFRLDAAEQERLHKIWAATSEFGEWEG